MVKNIYTPQELNSQVKCVFCPEEKLTTWRLKTRRIKDDVLLSLDNICDDCKIKYDRDELKKCLDCERLYKHKDFRVDIMRTIREQSKTNLGEWYCMCEHLKDTGKSDDDEVVIGGSANLENQINELSQEKEQLIEDVDIAISGQTAAQRLGRTQANEILTKENYKLVEKSRRLSDENKTLKKQVGELENQLLGVEETSKKVRRLSNENRILKDKVEGLETEIEKYKGETSELKPGISQLKSDILELEAKLEKMLTGIELETKVEQPPK